MCMGFVISIWNWISNNHDALIALFTIGIFIVTYSLAQYTKKLWDSTNKIVKEAKESSERELRAYISVMVKTIPIIGEGQDPQVIFAAKNVGKTPAYDTELSVAFGITSFPFIQSELDYIDKGLFPNQGAITLAPDCELAVTHFSGHALNAKDMKDLTHSKTAVLFLRGTVTYTDAFDNPCFTRFSFSYGDDFSIRMGGMLATQKGNETDRPS